MIKLLYSLIFSFFLFSCTSLKEKNIENQNNKVVIISDIPGLGITIKNHYKITTHYIGTLEDGTEFDNSYKRNQPFVFQYGLRQVIEGWEIGLKGMKIGGKRKIKIPPNLAYGKKGVKNIIPSNAFLIFNIEILDIANHQYILIDDYSLKDILNERIIRMSNINFILIDIRTKRQIIKDGLIKGSYHIEAFNKNGNMNPNFIKDYKMITNKSDHVVLISQYGEISSILANGLTENLGIQNVYSLRGGIDKWKENENKLF